MEYKDLFEKNLVLSMEFNQYILDNPEVADRILNDSLVVILPD